MAWSYWAWVGCSVGTSVGIFVLTLVVLLILLFANDTIFYAIVAQLLNIERCYIDAHHNIIHNNQNIHTSTDVFQNHIIAAVLEAKQFQQGFTGTNDTGSDSKLPGNEQSNSQKPEERMKNFVAKIFENVSNTSAETKPKTEPEASSKAEPERSPESESHPEHMRAVLNVYGKYIAVNKKGSLIFLMTLTTIIISGALIAAFNSLVLTTSSVYVDGPCPTLGLMECFCGSNYTYFTCNTGQTASFPLDVHSGSCFRWVARDLTTSDITTQLGVTTGILVAFGSMAQAIIRIYLLAFNKRLSIATGLHHIAAKTIGINRDTARTRCWCCNLPWHCSACNLSLFKNPAAVILVTAIYIAIPFLMIPGVIMLYYYQLSVTSLTFVVLIVIAIVCILSIVWIMVQENEASSNIPGGWKDAGKLVEMVAMKGKSVTQGGISPSKNFKGP
ncbi:unnamed protein product [Adineta steineri]|uniref:Uncharacterized protein n=1 Tax=Adineta steineri TaxID=433720 RepID=A0A815C4P3_9BILA|nr:unnamed protein product [Adineta steineri]CAF1282165.1 unnamed protein product [Adineta steineri]CAF1564198.1 unnamed protein product [Adineta steineri]CAF1564953.1 unnamed protein product [Adineta steineri]